MPLNISDAESAYLKGRARFEEWKRNFEMEWYKPVFDRSLMAILKNLETLPDEVKKELKAMYPDEMEWIEKKLAEENTEV